DEDIRYEDMKKRIMDEVKKTFRPEFINRVDDIIVFHSLNKEHLKQIVDLMLERVNKRMLENGLSLTVSDRAKEIIVDEGHDVEFGARPLRRAIMRLVEDPLAEKILDGEFEEGDKVFIDADEEGKMTFTKAPESISTTR